MGHNGYRTEKLNELNTHLFSYITTERPHMTQLWMLVYKQTFVRQVSTKTVAYLMNRADNASVPFCPHFLALKKDTISRQATLHWDHEMIS